MINDTNIEAELTSRIAAGDSSAFKVIFDKYYAQLVYFARKFIDDDQEVEDLVMEVFTRFWEKREQATAVKSISAYLFGSVRNVCIDAIRRQSRKPSIVFGEELRSHVDDLMEGEEIFVRVLAQVNEAIDGLPTQCRTIFKLIYIEGKSSKEIAELLHLSVQSVRNQKTRALALLRARVKSPHMLSLALLQLAVYQSLQK